MKGDLKKTKLKLTWFDVVGGGGGVEGVGQGLSKR